MNALIRADAGCEVCFTPSFTTPVMEETLHTARQRRGAKDIFPGWGLLAKVAWHACIPLLRRCFQIWRKLVARGPQLGRIAWDILHPVSPKHNRAWDLEHCFYRSFEPTRFSLDPLLGGGLGAPPGSDVCWVHLVHQRCMPPMHLLLGSRVAVTWKGKVAEGFKNGLAAPQSWVQWSSLTQFAEGLELEVLIGETMTSKVGFQ